MKKLLMLSAAMLGTVAATHAGVDVHVGFNFPVPLPPRVIISHPAPPPVVIEQPPVVVQQPQVVYAPPYQYPAPPEPVYAPPVPAPYCPPPVVVAPPVVVGPPRAVVEFRPPPYGRAKHVVYYKGRTYSEWEWERLYGHHHH